MSVSTELKETKTKAHLFHVLLSHSYHSLDLPVPTLLSVFLVEQQVGNKMGNISLFVSLVEKETRKKKLKKRKHHNNNSKQERMQPRFSRKESFAQPIETHATCQVNIAAFEARAKRIEF
jgi:hypothetical protein